MASGDLPVQGYDPIVADSPLPFNLRGLREWAKMTPKEAAENLFLDPSQLWRFENGERIPSAEIMADYIQLFDLDYHQSSALIEMWEVARGR